jgi:catechol 2,3-dioxygenase-like lactoylglutathione lyase family enzyme
MDLMPTLALLVARCRDLEQSRRFYQALGLVFTAEQHGTGPLHYSCQLGTTVLELYPAMAAASNVRLGFGVTDVIAAVESVRAIGARVDREPTPQARTAVVRDPDDNAVELSPT